MLLMAGAMAFAQTPGNNNQREKLTPEQKAEISARHMADELLLSDKDAADFIPVYAAYKMDVKAISAKYRIERKPSSEKTDAEIDAEIRSNFQKSQEILNNRIAYYEKFTKILSPRQIREMYKVEKEHSKQADFKKFMKNHPGAAHQAR